MAANKIESVESLDMDFGNFVKRLYENPLQKPFSYTLQFLTEIPHDQAQNYLGYILTTGAKELFDKELVYLSQEQIETLREYMHSIGWDAEYQVTTQENQGQKYNQWYIEFFPCKRSLDILNAPEHMA